jgi:hypothetical protein
MSKTKTASAPFICFDEMKAHKKEELGLLPLAPLGSAYFVLFSGYVCKVSK